MGGERVENVRERGEHTGHVLSDTALPQDLNSELQRVARPVNTIATRFSTSVSGFIPLCVGPNPKVSRYKFGGVIEGGVAELLQSYGVSEKDGDFRNDTR